MSWAILHDAEQEVAALIDPDSGRALGPIAGGENAKEILERFADTVGVDPSTLADWDIQARWKDWMVALTSTVHDAEGIEHRVGDLIHGAEHPEGGAEQVVDPTKDAPSITTASSEHTQAGASTSSGQPDPTNADTATQSSNPVTQETVSQGYALCPTCSGFRDVVDAGGTHPCPTCHGKGELPVDRPAAT